MKRWFRPFDLHARSFTNSFVCNFLSSSAGINLCRCFSRLTLAFCFRFQLSLGFHFHGLSPLPLLFLTSAVFAPFRSLQFWILTTQPLFLPFPFFLPPPHSGFLSAPLSLSFLRSSPFFPAWFPVHSFPVPVLSFAVCFLSPFPDSLPQLFLRCLPSDLSSGIFRSASASFRPLLLPFRLLSPLLLPFCPLAVSPHSRLFVQARFLSSPSLFPFIHGWFPIRFVRFCLLSFLFVSFRPSLLRSHSRSTGASLLGFPSGIGA